MRTCPTASFLLWFCYIGSQKRYVELMPFPIAVSCEARVEQWWVRSPPTYVARVQIPASTPYVGWVCCWFSPLLREVFLRVLRFSPLLKNLHFQIPIRPGIRWLCGLLTNPSHFFNLGRGKTPKLELLWIVCNFYVLSLCSYRDLSRATASFHKCFCFVDGVTSWEKKNKNESTGYPLWFCQISPYQLNL